MAQHQLTVSHGMARLPGPEGERFVELFRHGTLSIELYAPRGRDPQSPHTRDEVYAVVQGKGQFRNGPERHRFGRVMFSSCPPGSSIGSRSSPMTWWSGCSSMGRKAGKQSDDGKLRQA
jgi:hypothetical protein